MSVSVEEASKLIHELYVEFRKLLEKARRERERRSRRNVRLPNPEREVEKTGTSIR